VKEGYRMNEKLEQYPILSKSASRLLNWKLINDTMRFALDEVGSDRSGHTEPAPNVKESIDHELVAKAFQALKGEFRRVLGPLRKQIIVSSTFILLSLAATISGAALLSIKPLSGGIVSIAGIGAMFPLLSRTWRLARDQAILELLPAKYEAILQLCRSQDQYNEALSRMMEELAETQNRTR
jgi:hypothetical protein